MTDEQLALLCQRAQHIVRHQAQAAPSNEGPMMAVVLERLIADHAEPKDIYELFREVREHPDFVFGTIFTTEDFDGEERVEKFRQQHGHYPEDRLAEIGNELIGETP